MTRFGYLILAALLCLPAIGCNKAGDDEGSDESTTESQSEESQSEESQPEEIPEISPPQVDLESLTAVYYCDSIDVDSECTDFTAEGIAVLSADSRAGICSNLAQGTFRGGACPVEERVGTCMIRTPPGPPGNRAVGQIVHYYGRGGSPFSLGSAYRGSNCMGGMFVPAP